jgi:hypothetical protein
MLYKAFRVVTSRFTVRAKIMKKRTTIYVEQAVWEKFMKYLIEKYGKTHGGVISEEVEKAILLLIKK